MGSTALVDVSSPTLDEEEDSSISFNSILLQTLFSLEIGERLLSGLFLSFFFFFFISSEGLDLFF